MKKGLKRLTSALAAFAITAMCLPCMPAVTVEAAVSTAVYTNLLAANHDPGFENGAVNTTYWNISGDATQSNEQAHLGSYSAKVTTAQTWRGPQAKLHGLVEGQEYYLSAWVYTDQTDLKAQFQLCGKTTVRTDHYPLTAGDWTQISVVVTAPAFGDSVVTDGHRLYVNTNADRTSPIYLDDFEVVPISVEGNMVQDFGFESGTINSSYYHTSGIVAASVEQAHSGKYSAKSSTNQTYSGPRAVVSGLEVGAKYYVSAWAYTSDSGLKAKIGMFDANNANSAYALPDDLVQGEWTRINSIIDAKYETAKFFVNMHSDPDTGTRTQPMYFDDFVVVPVSSTVENGDTDVIPNADITLTIPEDVPVNTSTLTIDGGAKVYSVKTDGRTHVVSFTGMESNTKYNLKLNDGKTINTTWTFTTGDYTNILESQGYDPDFEGDAIDTSKWIINKDCTTRLVTEKALSGNRSIYVTNRNADYRGAQAQGVVLGNGDYYISGWVYPVTSGTKARVRIQEQDGTCNDLVSKTVTANEWNHLSGIVTCSDITKPVYFYIQTEGSKNDVYMDNLEIISLTPPAAEVYSPLNGAEKVSVNTDLKLVFNQAVSGVIESNIQLNNGATVGDIASADNKTFTVDLGTLNTNTTYTATVTGVVDAYGNTVADTTFTFKTASHAGYENILVTQGYDVGFETGLDNYDLKGTVNRTDSKKNTGAYSALSTARTGGYFGARAKVNLEENTEYLMSAWVYTETTGEAIQMRLQGADVGAIGDFKGITAGQWNHVTAITNTSSDQAVVTGAYFYPLTNTNNDIWVDDYELVKIGKLPSSDKYAFDNSVKKVTLKKAYTDKYDSMDDIVDDIIGASDYDISVNDKDESGDWTTGDELILTSKTAGADYKKVYSVDVRNYYDSSTEALIVKGSDGIGDDFSHSDKITKAGKAFIEYRVENNADEAITPVVMAAVYDEDGKFLEMDIADTQTIPQNEYKDFDLEVTIPSNVEGATVKLMVWDGFDSMEPLMPAKVYTIDTNDFTVPNVISDNMVLQRNSNAVIFGKAPEGATVTATLGNNITGTYTVKSGDNEFFVELPMGNANTIEQTLTITSQDKYGNNLGTITRSGILVGDVYYGSGQSNMARQFNKTAEAIQSGSSTLYTPDQYDSYVDEYKKLGDTLSTQNVRFFKNMTEGTTKSRSSWDAEALAAKEVWKKIDRNSIDEMYQVMVRMAAEIKSIDEYKDVPIGILCCAQGGTIAAKWVSRDTFFSAGFEEEYDNYEKNVTRADASTYWASHTDLYYDGARSVLPYTVKAAVWYQGQSDASSNYDKYLTGVIHDIRESQKNDMLPVLVLGLFGSRDVPNTKLWPVQRLGQLNVANQLTNVYTTITNDTGDPTASDPYHPANDADVAHRAARSMLANVYGENINWRGPEFASVSYTDDSATISVNTNGGTLDKYDTTVGSPIFELTTDGGTTWTAANSIAVNGNTITVSNSSITGTVNGVRYAMTPLKVKCIYATYSDAMGTNEILPLVPFDTTYVPNANLYK